MYEMNLSIYAATRDNPGGPTIVMEDVGDGMTIEPFRNENGAVTKGGLIGYSAAYAMMAGAVLYCMFLL